LERNRRSLTDAELLKCVTVLDERKKTGPKNSFTPSGVKLGASSETTAELLGVSPRTVERVRTVLDHAPEPLREAVERGEKTVNAAYTETQERRKEERRNQSAKWRFERKVRRRHRRTLRRVSSHC
jgi:hypothetical protein